MKHSKYIFVILINLLIFIGLILFAETTARMIKFSSTCVKGNCAYDYLKLKKTYFYKNFSDYHPVLGYIPKEDYSEKIDILGWDNVTVTLKNRFRSNGNIFPKSQINHLNILTVGDSFTFGDQVNDDETWPSCIEREIDANVFNGGVYGYGAARAVLRAELESREKKYDILIWSILVGHDWGRDTIRLRRFPNPVVIKKENSLSFLLPPEQRETWFSIDFLQYFYTAKKVLFAFDKMTLQEHIEVASIPEIIEFSVDRFSKIIGPAKVIVLQYSSDYMLSLERDKEEISLIKKYADLYEIPVIDTADIFTGQENSKVWKDHHTPYGNSLLCNKIANDLVNWGIADKR